MEEALSLSNAAVMEALGGLPPAKVHCSVLAEEVAGGMLRVEDIDEGLVGEHLYTAGQPDPDLLIRTSGEQRISNFLLYQLAYTELVFVEQHWPDFSVDVYFDAIRQYAGRDRRFGGLG